MKSVYPSRMVQCMYFFLFIFLQAVVSSFSKIPQGGESEELQCIVCSDEPPSVRFEPCGHTIACKGMDNYFKTSIRLGRGRGRVILFLILRGVTSHFSKC